MKNKRDWAGLIGGGILIFSLFMPWISGVGILEKAIDIKHGYLLLSFGVIACLIAVIKIFTKNTSKVYFIYPILGILSLLVLYLYYGESARRAQRIVSALPFLSDFMNSYIGPGVYAGMAGCAIMIGSLFLGSDN
jgi:hypothetical protein